MPNSSSPPQHFDPHDLAFPIARRRATIACSNCRKRKVRCLPSDQPPHNTCQRCSRKYLTCQYTTVTEDLGKSPAPDGSAPENRNSKQGTSPAVPTTWKKPMDPGYSSQFFSDDSMYMHYPPHYNNPSTPVSNPGSSIPRPQHTPYGDVPRDRPPQPYPIPATWHTQPRDYSSPANFPYAQPMTPSDRSPHTAPHLHANGPSMYHSIPAVDHTGYTQWNVDHTGPSFYRPPRA
ncbi:hypothetical protein C8J57DRAFT_1277549 [Mycena rebaudengoi]|nr:hypothetical protein C8J57DRAFT_1277549 [Mycena rebaudengoi]